MKKGKFIVFEGISGTGKETQARLLVEYLKTKSITAHIVYHPSSELKPLMKKWLQDRQADWKTIVYLLLADRYNRVSTFINPALERGEWVISLRNYVSAIVYQGESDETREWIKKQFLQFEPRANALIYFYIDPAKAFERILKRHQETGEALGRFETLQKLKEKRSLYRKVLKTISHFSVPAGKTRDIVHALIIDSLKRIS